METNNYTSYLIGDILKNVRNELDKICIEALKNKGFDLTGKHVNEIESFMRERCRCEDFTHEKRKIYYVDNIPFLLYDYLQEMNLKWNFSENRITLSAESGSFKFL